MSGTAETDNGAVILEPSSETQHVSRFLATVSSIADEASILRTGITALAEVVDADDGAIMRGEAIVATAALAADTSAIALRAAAGAARLDAAGGSTLAVGVETDTDLRLILLRARPFHESEVRLVRAMARVLMLAVHSVRALDRERRMDQRARRGADDNATQLAQLLERQGLLERLGRAQRTIAKRGSITESLDAVVAAVAEMFDDEIVSIRLIEENDPAHTFLASSRSLEAPRRLPVATGPSGRAISEGRLIVLEGAEARETCGRLFGDARIDSAMAAPLITETDTIGALMVATRRRGRRYSRQEREMFMVLAEAAAIAIDDARAAAAAGDGLQDPLTGLPNRALFLDRLRHALASSRRAATRAGAIAIDLDRFALVNDGYGQIAGDGVLVEVAARITACLRACDTASRFGGDEFGVVVRDVSGLTDVIPVAERILSALRAPISVGGREVSLGGSIGIAIATAEESAEELLRHAAVAMQEAKAAGRGRYEIFEPGMHERLVSRVQLQSDLERALANDEMALYYQPIVALADGSITGFEALLRWRHPERGLVLPDEFIPLAEDLGTIIALDRWVLRRACADLARFAPDQALRVNVNLSARDIREPDLVDAISDALGTSGLAADRLVLEITETGLLSGAPIVEQLHALKGLGVRIAIDDFGTGYGSLSYLQRFPIDTIKIDRAFVTGAQAGRRDDDGWALARAIVRIGQALNIETVAEGIETETQRDALIALGCTTGQGFFFAQPLPADAIPGLIGPPGQRHLRSVG